MECVFWSVWQEGGAGEMHTAMHVLSFCRSPLHPASEKTLRPHTHLTLLYTLLLTHSPQQLKLQRSSAMRPLAPNTLARARALLPPAFSTGASSVLPVVQQCSLHIRWRSQVRSACPGRRATVSGVASSQRARRVAAAEGAPPAAARSEQTASAPTTPCRWARRALLAPPCDGSATSPPAAADSAGHHGADEVGPAAVQDPRQAKGAARARRQAPPSWMRCAGPPRPPAPLLSSGLWQAPRHEPPGSAGALSA
jgi:hypothetical protein